MKKKTRRRRGGRPGGGGRVVVRGEKGGTTQRPKKAEGTAGKKTYSPGVGMFRPWPGKKNMGWGDKQKKKITRARNQRNKPAVRSPEEQKEGGGGTTQQPKTKAEGERP